MDNIRIQAGCPPQPRWKFVCRIRSEGRLVAGIRFISGLRKDRQVLRCYAIIRLADASSAARDVRHVLDDSRSGARSLAEIPTQPPHSGIGSGMDAPQERDRPSASSARPRVSVIIPCFNRSAQLREAVESVLAQTYQDFEILIIDDGSTDDTRVSLENRFRGNPRIRYFYKNHGGPGPARNLGLGHAVGEYIAFLDSDDLWLPEKLENQIRQL